MFDFFKPSRARTRHDTLPAEGMPSAQPAAAEAGRAAEPAVSSRDLARVALRDVLRRNGIPLDWISSQIVSRTQAGQPTAHQIQLVILKWHEGLLRFAPLLQQQILQSMQQFDPHADPAAHSVVWSFAPHCGCPYTTLPAPAYWSASTDRQSFDLPPTSRKFHEVDDDFATTVPSALG